MGTAPARHRGLVRWIIAVSVLALLLGAVAATAARRFDSSHRQELLSGIEIGGVPVGGLRIETARARLEEAFERPLDRSIAVEVDGKGFAITPRALDVRSDALERLEEVIAAQAGMPFGQRVWRRLSGAPLGRNVKVSTTVSEPPLTAFVSSIAEEVSRRPENASVRFIGDQVQIAEETPGYALDAKTGVEQLRAAIASGARKLHLEGSVVEPSLHRRDITDVLVIKVGQNKLLHFRAQQLLKEYDVATGVKRFPTPLGQFRVVNKRRSPTWVNPAKFPGGWGESLPAKIGPGPKNPLGTRALDLNAAGIRIHGTSAAHSIGYNASHGCIRMRIPESEELFEQVAVGTPVVIVASGEYRSVPKEPSTGNAPTAPEPTAESDATRIPGQPGGPSGG
ncbi:MAG: L,D-transpeptidase family protein [Actinomycetota bacterium]